MTDIASLAYLGVRSDKLRDWSDFACNLLGMQQVDKQQPVLVDRCCVPEMLFGDLVVTPEHGRASAVINTEEQVRDTIVKIVIQLEYALHDGGGCGYLDNAGRLVAVGVGRVRPLRPLAAGPGPGAGA